MESPSGGVDWATSQETSQLKVIAREEDTPWGIYSDQFSDINSDIVPHPPIVEISYPCLCGDELYIEYEGDGAQAQEECCQEHHQAQQGQQAEVVRCGL